MTKTPQELELTLSLADGEMILRIDSFEHLWCLRLPNVLSQDSTRAKDVRHTGNRVRPTAEQVHARLDGLCEGTPAQDSQSPCGNCALGEPHG